VLGLIATYPFMKRITYWPQLFLGSISTGAP
jgi:4-hydroxybenzoate polyprenyltransferase